MDYTGLLNSDVDWIQMYDTAVQQHVDPLLAMTEHFKTMQEEKSGSKPMRATTASQKERQSVFKPVNTDELKASRETAKKDRANKARERKVKAVREKTGDTLNNEAQKQLGSDSEEDDDFSISDMF